MNDSPSKKMVITIDIDKMELESVTDEKGKPAIQEEKAQINGRDIVNAPNGTLLFTHSSPGCCWYYWHGRWYWICT